MREYLPIQFGLVLFARIQVRLPVAFALELVYYLTRLLLRQDAQCLHHVLALKTLLVWCVKGVKKLQLLGSESFFEPLSNSVDQVITRIFLH